MNVKEGQIIGGDPRACGHGGGVVTPRKVPQSACAVRRGGKVTHTDGPVE